MQSEIKYLNHIKYPKPKDLPPAVEIALSIIMMAVMFIGTVTLPVWAEVFFG